MKNSEKKEYIKKKWRYGIVLAMLFLIILQGLHYMQGYYQEKERLSFKYEESQENLINPARGFYTQIYYKEYERLAEVRAYGHMLALVTMNLNEYMEEELPERNITWLKQLFEEAREQGIMIIFRAAYLQGENLGEPEMSVIYGHIQQLSKVMNEYKDVVLVVQTGLVGLWGEWHGSKYLEDDEALRTQAMKVVEWWLMNLDASINLNLRRPLFIQTAVELGLDGSRLGMHNDALLATHSDMGTYLDREADLKWCEENLNAKVNGGEMPYISEYTEPEYAIKELEQLSLTYLNAHYNVEVLEDWAKQKLGEQSAYEYIEQHLGYRYYVKTIDMPKRIFDATDNLNITVALGNSGFSTIHNRFKLYMVINDEENTTFYPMNPVSTEKHEEFYECSIVLPEKKAFRIGFCYTDLVDETENQRKTYAHTVEFANADMCYEDGINYFVEYVQNDEEKILVPQKLK